MRLRRVHIAGWVFMYGCAGSLSSTSQPTRAASTGGETPAWVTDLEANVVVLSTTFRSPNFESDEQGAGIIVGLTEHDATVLTAQHLLVQSMAKLDGLEVRFSVANTAKVTMHEGMPVVSMRNELAAITVPLTPETAAKLRETVKPVRLGGPSEAAQGKGAIWFSGRCGGEGLRSFRVPQLRIINPNTSEFSLSDVNVQPGCSGGSILLDGRLIGVMQTTETTSNRGTSTAEALGTLREVRPHDDGNRNLLEPYGTLAFESVPYLATYSVETGPTRPLLAKNLVRAGQASLDVRQNDSAEVAHADLMLGAEQQLNCTVDFASSMSRFRDRYRFWLLGGSAAIALTGLGFLGLAETASDDFDSDWSRSARDRNHLYFDIGFWTLVGGTVAVAAASVFAFSGDARERSTVECR